MKVFLAGCGLPVWNNAQFYDFYRLHSFFDICKKETLVLHKYKDFLLDSGAFAFFGGHQKISIDLYIDNYIEFINKNNIANFFELDLYTLPQYGIQSTEKIRAKIMQQTLKKPIPVFHYMLGFDYFKMLCDNFEYIAISASGKYTSAWTRQRPDILKAMVQYANSRNTKVHDLGYTNLKELHNIPFYSVDSTSWLAGVRYCQIHFFNGATITQKQKPENTRQKNYKLINTHNFHEWIKFQKYADINL